MRVRAYNPSGPANPRRALNLRVRLEGGRPAQQNPATGRLTATFKEEQGWADAERNRANRAESRADSAAARFRELEEENQRLRGGG